METHTPAPERIHTPVPGPWKVALLRVAALFIFAMGLLALVTYFAEQYLPFIASDDSAPVYFFSALRMTCRLGYPIAAIALFFLYRWGLWLMVIVWLAQLVPSSVYTVVTGGELSGHVGTLIEFALTIGLLCACRSALRAGTIARPLVIFLVSVLTLHSVLFLAIGSAPASAGIDTQEPGVAGQEGATANDSLVAAVHRADEQAVRQHLGDPATVKRELDPVCPKNSRCKPISFAAETGNLAILTMLLDAGADPDGATSYGDTPLIIAIMHGHRGAIDLLLQYKADINKTNRSGVSAFTGAVAMGNLELVAKFIDHGADVNRTFPFRDPQTKQVREHSTPLGVATQMGHTQVVELLLRNNARMGTDPGQ